MHELELANSFDRRPPQLRAIAYRILGSVTDADDAVPEGVAAAAADRRRADRQLLQVVLDTLRPAERLAFVLHDMFAAPFDEIAAMVDRSPQATRRRPRRAGRGAITARQFAPYVRPALVNGAAGVVAFDGEQPFAVLAFTVIGDRAVAIDVLNPPNSSPSSTSAESPHHRHASAPARTTRMPTPVIGHDPAPDECLHADSCASRPEARGSRWLRIRSSDSRRSTSDHQGQPHGRARVSPPQLAPPGFQAEWDDHWELRQQFPCQHRCRRGHLGRVAVTPCSGIKPVVGVEHGSLVECSPGQPAKPDDSWIGCDGDGPEPEADLMPFALPTCQLRCGLPRRTGHSVGSKRYVSGLPWMAKTASTSAVLTARSSKRSDWTGVNAARS